MLTRLKVNGFKNLVDVDVRFGPFTCIAGANGVGKSNLFDAIHFLSALADRPLVDAALSVRDEGGRTADVRSLFHRVGGDYASEMTFDAEMIVPKTGVDDLGQMAEASITFLRYSLTLAYRADDSKRAFGSLELVKEELTHITLGEAKKHLLFPHKPEWFKSAVRGQRRVPFFISTEGEGINRVVKLHQDGGSSGRPLSRSAVNLPRTLLSAANAAESPTALLARREMQSWQMLQLEPSALREPDEFTAPTRLGMDGSFLPATLYHLARSTNAATEGEEASQGGTDEEVESQTYSGIASRLSELIHDVREVTIDRDERRELLTVQVTGRDGTSHPARALSDGTLRFLALVVLELDPEAQGLICLEEPENGIHPERIAAMLQLLQDIAADTSQPVSSYNPLRQVIINTHSPAVVGQIPDESLLVAEPKDVVQDGRHFQKVCFSYLPDTWRTSKATERDAVSVVPRGKLISYLNPFPAQETQVYSNGSSANGEKTAPTKAKRVIDRLDMKQLVLDITQAEV